MEYEQFAEKFIEELENAMKPEKVELCRRKSIKVNQILDGVSVKYPNSIVAPVIYLEEKYKCYQEGYTVHKLVKEAEEYLKNVKQNMLDKSEISVLDAKKNLYCAIINAEENEELLKNSPHEGINDLAVIARCKVGENSSFIVTNDLCDYLQMTSEEILEQAHRNTEKQTFQCKNMNQVMRDMMLEEGMPEEDVNELISMLEMQCSMYVVSNETMIDGAAAMVSKTAMNQAYEIIGDDFYILPSSRHELILMPKGKGSDVQDLKLVVKEVNKTVCPSFDRLSDNVYRYDGRTKKITFADEKSLKQDKGITKIHGRKH